MIRKTHVTQIDEKTGKEIEAGRYEEWGPPAPIHHCTSCVLCEERKRIESGKLKTS